MSIESGISAKVDLGIADTIRAVDEIIERRRKRKSDPLSDFVSNLCDILDAGSEIVKTLDSTFIKLVQGFANKSITGEPSRLNAHMELTQNYLSERDLLPKLEFCIGELNSASLDRRLASQTYRDIVSTMRSLVKRLELYRDNLGKGGYTGVGQTEKMNLQTLREYAHRFLNKQGQDDNPIEQIAEEVLRNHDFDMSDNIHRLTGKIRVQVRSLRD